jgi:hypothetical protein
MVRGNFLLESQCTCRWFYTNCHKQDGCEWNPPTSPEMSSALRNRFGSAPAFPLGRNTDFAVGKSRKKRVQREFQWRKKITHAKLLMPYIFLCQFKIMAQHINLKMLKRCDTLKQLPCFRFTLFIN